MRIPLKPADPFVAQLVRVGVVGAWVGTVSFLLRAWLPALLPEFARPYYWLVLVEGATVLATICLLTALAVGGLKDRGGGPPTV